MLETAITAFTTLFATIGAIDVAAVFSGLTASHDSQRRRSVAIRGTLIAAIILFLFALFGKMLLSSFGISLPALRTSGGILLLLISIEMVFARESGATSTTHDEVEEATSRPDISVFPIATPLIAGPGAMGAIILLMAKANGDFLHQGIVMAALVLNLAIVLLLMLGAERLQRLLGVTGVQVIGRVMGVILAALAMQFIFDGIKDAGLFG